MSEPLKLHARGPDREIIDQLEWLLKRAKDGELAGLVWCTSDGAGTTSQGCSGMVFTARMLGSLEILKAKIMREYVFYGR